MYLKWIVFCFFHRPCKLNGPLKLTSEKAEQWEWVMKPKPAIAWICPFTIVKTLLLCTFKALFRFNFSIYLFIYSHWVADVFLHDYFASIPSLCFNHALLWDLYNLMIGYALIKFEDAISDDDSYGF